MKKSTLLYLLLVGFLALASCNRSYNKVLKNPDPSYRLEMAHKYYNEGKYEKAQPLFEEHLTMNKGIRNSEEVLFLYAYCFYYMKDYTMGAFYFRNFTTSYPSSFRVEEASYMMALCYEKESPRYTLEQTNTHKAIDQYQSFANRFPNSDRIQEVNDAIDRLREKLLKKAYESAYLYYKIRQYQAASVALKALLKDYPDIEDQDKIHYYVVKSNKYYADHSTTSKKHERYEATAKECTVFREKYPSSPYVKEVEGIYNSSIQEIEKYKNIDENGKQKRRS